MDENTALRKSIMPRANRYFLPDHVWHITHRCHKKEFLLSQTVSKNYAL